jgi:hypothetical protein
LIRTRYFRAGARHVNTRLTRRWSGGVWLLFRTLTRKTEGSSQLTRADKPLAKPRPWLRVEALSAALARDVVERHERLRRHWIRASAPASNCANCAEVLSLGGRSRILLSTLASDRN